MTTEIPIPLPTRSLGKNGPQVSAIGLGCMGLNAFYSKPVDDPQKVLAKALELGCSFWDTADVYLDNEAELSKILKDRKDEVFLATKFGSTAKGPNGKPEYVNQALERSLEKLKLPSFELYYMHRMDPDTPIEDTINALVSKINEGKIKYIGLSECSDETLRRAHKIHPISCVQIEYSPWTLDIETNGVLDTCRELGIAIVAYSPLGRGFLTGKYKKFEDLAEDDWRRSNPRFQGENFQKNLDIVKEFERMADKKRCSAGQLCLAWVLFQGDDIIPIPGTTSIKNLEQNLASLSVKITKEDDHDIREVINKLGVSGDRYSKSMMSNLNK